MPNEQEYSFTAFDEFMTSKVGWRHPEDWPEKLFHYTSSAALLNIVRSQELWFTDYRYLNDLSELTYGVDLFKEEIETRKSTEQDERIKNLLELLRRRFDTALIYTDVFVFCMCTENNLLNQWRVYGRDTIPVSIEIGTRSLVFGEWA